jgi:hypothetical protein
MSEASVKTNEVRKHTLVRFLSALVLLAVAACELLLLSHFSDGILQAAKAFFALVALFGLGVTFFSKNKGLGKLAKLADDLVTADAASYLRATFMFLSFLFLFPTVGLARAKEPSALAAFGRVLWMPAALVVLVYALLHLLVVAPLAYLPIVLASALVESVIKTSGDVEVLAAAKATAAEKQASIQNVIEENRSAVTAFLVGAPAALVALGTTIADLVHTKAR